MVVLKQKGIILRERLKMSVKTSASWLAQALKTRPWTPSGPGAFRGLTALNDLNTSGWEIFRTNLFSSAGNFTAGKVLLFSNLVLKVFSSSDIPTSQVFLLFLVSVVCDWVQTIPHALNVRSLIVCYHLVNLFSLCIPDGPLKFIPGLPICGALRHQHSSRILDLGMIWCRFLQICQSVVWKQFWSVRSKLL